MKLKRPKQLQEILDTARSLLAEIQHRAAGPELEEKQGKLEQLKSVLEMCVSRTNRNVNIIAWLLLINYKLTIKLSNIYRRYGHFSGINRKVQMKYQPRGRPRGSSSDDGNDLSMACSLFHYFTWLSNSRKSCNIFQRVCIRTRTSPLFFSSRSTGRTVSRFDIEVGWWIDAGWTYSSGRIRTHIPLHVPRWSR